MTEKTEEEVKKAYGFARTMGRRFTITHPRPVNYLDEDDYTQEAIMAWLEKKHIPFRLVDLYRKEAPVGRREWIRDKENITFHDPVNVDDVADMLASDIDVEEDAEKLVKLKAIQKIVDNMIDPRQQIIIILHYGYDRPIGVIAKGLGLSRSYTDRLHREALEHIKKEIKENGD